MRLINADALKEAIKQNASIFDGVMTIGKEDAKILKFIDNIPTIEERKKGEWNYTEFPKKYDNGASILLRGYECPFCKNFINRKCGKKNYCDFCGADMRGGKDV